PQEQVRLPDPGHGGHDVFGAAAEAPGSGLLEVDRDRADQPLTAFFDILIGGVFHAAVLFLVAAGLQLVFGVQKIVNLACGSFYALGAYFGITFIGYAHQFGVSEWLILPGLVVSGVLLGFIGPPIERMLRTVYDRD